MIYRNGNITWLEIGEIPALPLGLDLTIVAYRDEGTGKLDVVVYDKRTEGTLRFMPELNGLEHQALQLARIRAERVGAIVEMAS